jgi:hypothetical protein
VEHPPEKSCTTGSKVADGITVTWWLVAVATNLYHTSSSAFPTQPEMPAVAPAVVPETGVQPAVTLSVVAEEQLSDWEYADVHASTPAARTSFLISFMEREINFL